VLSLSIRTNSIAIFLLYFGNKAEKNLRYRNKPSISIERSEDCDRKREEIAPSPAPVGGSAGPQSGEGTENPDEAADPGRCDPGEGVSDCRGNGLDGVGA
jgi:hypothetical protein